MRLVLGLAAAAGVGALGAVVLGEYTFSGVSVLGSGVLLGLFVAEAAVAVSRRRGVALGLASGAVAGTAMTWAAWISTGRDLSFLEPEGWAAVALAALAAGIRGWWPRRARDSSPREPAPAE
jgi:ABC-type cobalamin transport system permease subunit